MVEPIPGLSPELQGVGVGRAPNEVALKQSSPVQPRNKILLWKELVLNISS